MVHARDKSRPTCFLQWVWSCTKYHNFHIAHLRDCLFNNLALEVKRAWQSWVTQDQRKPTGSHIMGRLLAVIRPGSEGSGLTVTTGTCHRFPHFNTKRETNNHTQLHCEDRRNCYTTPNLSTPAKNSGCYNTTFRIPTRHGMSSAPGCLQKQRLTVWTNTTAWEAS